jgi:hypothetical protein
MIELTVGMLYVVFVVANRHTDLTDCTTVVPDKGFRIAYRAIRLLHCVTELMWLAPCPI